MENIVYFVNIKVYIFLLLGNFLKTLGERVQLIQKESGKTLPKFAKSLGVSRHSLINYQKNRTYPDSRFLSTLCELYRVDPTWLLMGEGEPFPLETDMIVPQAAMLPVSDPVEQLLAQEEERAGLNLTPEQRTAILKILRELVSRDVCAIRELLLAIPGGQHQGQE
jgi:transcriptional regulator with XRE-family HTH domain